MEEPKIGILGKGLNYKNLDFQIESICVRQNRHKLKSGHSVGKGRQLCGKRGKCWLPAFSPFPTMFSKALSFRVIKSWDCALKGSMVPCLGIMRYERDALSSRLLVID